MENSPTSSGRFPTTSWTLVLRSSEEGGEARSALEALCKSYWQPVFVFFRRSGESVHDSEDLTQGFFEDLLKRGTLDKAIPEKGRFRNYLLVAAKRYRLNEMRKKTARKRGGRYHFFSLDFAGIERQLSDASGTNLPPDRSFDRQWIATLVDRVFEAVKETYEETGRGELFREIQGCLAFGEVPLESHAEIGKRLGMNEGAIKTAVYRLKKRFRRYLEEEISRTLEDGESVEEELSYLIGILGK